MAAVTFAPTARPATKITPRSEPKAYKSLALNLREFPVIHITNSIEGIQTKADYFSNILTATGESRPLDPNLAPTEQQYMKINDMSLHIIDGLSSSKDDATGEVSIIGSANIPNVIVPIKNDYIVQELLNGQVGLFNITHVEKQTYLKQAHYKIDYKLVKYLSPSDVEAKDLANKSSKEYFYDEDLYIAGEDPLVRDWEQEYRLRLEAKRKPLIEGYMRMFFDKSMDSITYRNNTQCFYDDRLVAFLPYIFSLADTGVSNAIHNFRTKEDRRKDWTILDLLTDKTRHTIDTITTKVKYVKNIKRFTQLYGLTDSVLYTDITHLVTTDATANGTEVSFPVTGDLTAAVFKQGELTIPVFHPVDADDYYILSKSFYDKDTTMSLLESLIWDYIKEKPISNAHVSKLVDSRQYWRDIEHYYLTPILILLMQYSLSTHAGDWNRKGLYG